MGRRPAKAICGYCERTFKIGPVGRVPTYCKPSCRVMAFDKRHQADPLSRDDRQRLLIWTLLQDAGLIASDKPLPMRKQEQRSRSRNRKSGGP